MTCSHPTCNRYVAVYPECWEHRTVSEGESRRPLGAVFDLVAHEWSGVRPGARTICRHGFEDWTMCAGCVAVADFDYGAWS